MLENIKQFVANTVNAIQRPKTEMGKNVRDAFFGALVATVIVFMEAPEEEWTSATVGSFVSMLVVATLNRLTRK